VSFGPSALGTYALDPGVPHNEFLHVFAMMGIVGFAAYVMVYFSAFRIARRCEREGGPGGMRARLAIYVQAILLIFIVGGMVSEMWTFRYMLALLFFLIGVLASPGGRSADGVPPERGSKDG
jgi:O-antigen ligase